MISAWDGFPSDLISDMDCSPITFQVTVKHDIVKPLINTLPRTARPQAEFYPKATCAYPQRWWNEAGRSTFARIGPLPAPGGVACHKAFTLNGIQANV